MKYKVDEPTQVTTKSPHSRRKTFSSVSLIRIFLEIGRQFIEVFLEIESKERIVTIAY